MTITRMHRKLRASRPSRVLLAALAVTVVILVAIALLVPLPTAVQLRDWSRSVGAWLPAPVASVGAGGRVR